ncbi:uncharacterized protein LOC111618511 [Centruroides sculpturatus]|uniref:uncharacterized protein LOC111618511 n=1 Tax=Centruroides sculpturatus TaxID=218467 RepID=UPI000C6EC916|nr:uncharacterized protein LOC111618511 [Centruroides sculpturatus]
MGGKSSKNGKEDISEDTIDQQLSEQGENIEYEIENSIFVSETEENTCETIDVESLPSNSSSTLNSNSESETDLPHTSNTKRHSIQVLNDIYKYTTNDELIYDLRHFYKAYINLDKKFSVRKRNGKPLLPRNKQLTDYDINNFKQELEEWKQEQRSEISEKWNKIRHVYRPPGLFPPPSPRNSLWKRLKLRVKGQIIKATLNNEDLEPPKSEMK